MNSSTSGVITVAKGIEIQGRHLAEWKSVLKPEIYAELESWATATNVQAETGLDIRRGQSLDNFIHNNLMEPRRTVCKTETADGSIIHPPDRR